MDREYTAREILLKNKDTNGEFLFDLIHVEVQYKLADQKKAGKKFLSDEDIDRIVAEALAEDVDETEYMEIPPFTRIRVSENIIHYLSMCSDSIIFTHTDLVNLIKEHLK